ncbi:response regulator [Clostridium septicum]|uniref:Transcriptional regulatory protein n=1 Tax=Clostridium septicum TaxID=1504 RepID=A0A9N7JKP9_CLOSE|nr:response regulator [Clostridium septicum]AYE34135.1 two-component system response regulator [Clostridium septicum]MDU1313066.1 response regulator [Clostridium septicum]QAS59503.1 response regulator [Clostridium septicum]UEC21236.1 response regulator [Clostridium septicum]USS00718.1 response regulator [Clostridium septicum]
MKKVMIIEDDPMVALINRKYVESIKGFLVEDVVSEKDKAIKILKSKSIDLILLDVYLPKENGIEILKAIRAEGILVDVIMITATNKVEKIKCAFAYGVVDYLIKPFEFDRFQEAINKFLAKDNLLKECTGIKQKQIDNLSKVEITLDLPKGLNEKTLKKLTDFLEENIGTIWTIREIASELGISNVTIKKYMEYLEEVGKVSSTITYGNIGRPEYKYEYKNSMV